ncbi:MAG TPA: response regulator [Haliangium sp.]|nr:response regulator [Haliangium sp.]
MHDIETILIIDDDATFLATYRNLLGQEGYRTETATSVGEALAKLERSSFSVVILDQKLQGPMGTDSGLDLIVDIRQRAPNAKIIIATGYAAPRAIERAFEAGVYDYLEKNDIFDTLLRVKVRHIFALAREQRLSMLDVEGREAALHARWQEALAETDRNRKGKLLEDVMVLLFRSVPGWHTEANVTNEIEEIDVVIRNESPDPIWKKETPFLIAECKHWSKPVGVTELRSFLWKLHHHYGRCHLGFFVSTQGFTGPFHETVNGERAGNAVVIAMDGSDLERLIQSQDRNAMLKELYQRAAIGKGKAS